MSKLFIGSAICNINARGQAALPESFYVAIQARGAYDRLYVARHHEAPCLVVFDQAAAGDQYDRMQDRRGGTPGVLDSHDDLLRQAFGCAAMTRIDDRGRLVIAPWLQEEPGKPFRALAVGKGDHFELWDLDVILEHGSEVLVMLARLHLRTLQKEVLNDEPVLPAIGPRPSAQHRRKQRVRVQPLPPLPMRHDPVAGLC